MESEVCCFSGHRDIPAAEREGLERLLDRYIEELSQFGVNQFLCGGALGFDTMAARAVLRAREKKEGLALLLAIPYRGIEKHRTEADRLEFEEILTQADSVHYIADTYDRDCMLRRNRYMVERSGICIAYMTHNSGGTAYTVAQALKKGIEVINLAVEL